MSASPAIEAAAERLNRCVDDLSSELAAVIDVYEQLKKANDRFQKRLGGLDERNAEHVESCAAYWRTVCSHDLARASSSLDDFRRNIPR
ncbi:hypothetical protein ACFPM7_28055 [Actinokineospora guangxiensis]|uniref:Excreted virulence factor EspC (Type VII ESX diderm) n=1 Tax=Actinokineospora guangxiensis TaxID=1490288 RepID=A0ABW0EW08_9PSEU